MHRIYPCVALVLSLLGGVSPAKEAASPSAPALPPAKTVLDRYLEATGGRAAYEKVQNKTLSGRF